MPDVFVNVAGNLTADPELRFTPSGAAVTTITVATNSRTFDKASGEYKDNDPTFLRCNVWRELAEDVADQLRRGDSVNVSGKLRQRSFESKEGSKVTVIEVDADGVFKSVRTKRSSGGGTSRNGGADPWGTAAQTEAPF